MHFMNAAHWTCVFFGLVLVVTGIISRLHGRTASGLPGPVMAAPDDSTASGLVLKRVTLVLVGMMGVLYGAYRLTH